MTRSSVVYAAAVVVDEAAALAAGERPEAPEAPDDEASMWTVASSKLVLRLLPVIHGTSQYGVAEELVFLPAEAISAVEPGSSAVLSFGRERGTRLVRQS
jgi:hypothetical protein